MKNELDETIDDVVEKIEKRLDLNSIKEKLGINNSMASKIYRELDLTKDPSDMNKEEKILAWFQSMCRNDTIALKALSEGTNEDGGFLVPVEVKAELIKSLEAPYRVRGLARVVHQKGLTMTVPKLGSRPHVTWTSENAAKIFNRLRAFVQTFNKKMMNSGEVLRSIILSQAEPVMAWKVQRIEAESSWDSNTSTSVIPPHIVLRRNIYAELQR